jgi:hypothetical protein
LYNQTKQGNIPYAVIGRNNYNNKNKNINKDFDAEWSNNEEEEHINWLSLTPPPFSIIVDTYGATFVKFMAYINDQEYQKD